MPKITKSVCKWWNPDSTVSVCLIPKAILSLSPSAPLPCRGWSSTSGSQMTPPRREGKGLGTQFAGKQGGEGWAEGQNWPSSL